MKGIYVILLIDLLENIISIIYSPFDNYGVLLAVNVLNNWDINVPITILDISFLFEVTRKHRHFDDEGGEICSKY